MNQPLTPEQQQLLNATPYSWIYERIGHGAEDATPAEAILFGHTLTDRELRKYIETMRRAEIVIASSSQKGYYFPGNIEELEKYVNTTEKTARSIFRTLRAARKLLKKMKAERISAG